MSDMTPARELDCRDSPRRQIVNSISTAILKIAVGDTLKVVATDPGSVADMASFSRSTGHEIIDHKEGGGVFTFFIRRTS